MNRLNRLPKCTPENPAIMLIANAITQPIKLKQIVNSNRTSSFPESNENYLKKKAEELLIPQFEKAVKDRKDILKSFNLDLDKKREELKNLTLELEAMFPAKITEEYNEEISRSGLNHRFNKIKAIAESISAKGEQK